MAQQQTDDGHDQQDACPDEDAGPERPSDVPGMPSDEHVQRANDTNQDGNGHPECDAGADVGPKRGRSLDELKRAVIGLHEIVQKPTEHAAPALAFAVCVGDSVADSLP